MKKFYCKLIDNQVILYLLKDDGSKKVINNNPIHIYSLLKYLESQKEVGRIIDNNLEIILPKTDEENSDNNFDLINSQEEISIVFLNYDEVFRFIYEHKNIVELLKNEKKDKSKNSSSQQAIIIKKPKTSYTKPKKSMKQWAIISGIPILLTGGIIFSALPKDISTDAKPTPPSSTSYVDSPAVRTEEPQKQPITYDSKNNTFEINESNIDVRNKPIFHDEKKVALDEPLNKITSQNIEEPIKLDVISEKEFLKNYINISDIEKVDEFFSEFVKTMLGYNKEYTIDDIADIFYETSQVPLEDKIEIVKTAFNLTDEELDAVAATLVAEGVGGGTKYIDVYASTTTALNHLQYPAWVNDIVRARGEELGHSLYGHTCYYSQFEAYKSDNYYKYLGDRTLIGYTSVIDTLYNNYVYGLIMHNYTQFRGAWIDVPNGKIFESGGNKYLDERRPEDRVVPEINEKNNSI